MGMSAAAVVAEGRKRGNGDMKKRKERGRRERESIGGAMHKRVGEKKRGGLLRLVTIQIGPHCI